MTEQLTRSVNVYGPAASGKTANAEALRKHYKADVVIEGEEGNARDFAKIKKGLAASPGTRFLILTHNPINEADIRRIESVSIADALKASGLSAPKKKRKKQPTYKHEARSGSVSDVVDAFSVVEELGSEMRENADSMQGTALESTGKYEATEEAANTLENIQSVDVPGCCEDLFISYTEMVNARKGRSPSRATRLSNAVSVMQAAVEAVSERVENSRAAHEDALLVDEVGDAYFTSDECDEAEQFVSELENAIGDCEGVEFPGMYG